jgi:hypothetical protein
MSPDRKCPDCDRQMHPIKLIDKTGRMDRQTDLEYALPEAKRSFWLGLLPVAGVVAACMCDGCGRILLYGVAGDAAK